jgi:hypothetical protein
MKDCCYDFLKVKSCMETGEMVPWFGQLLLERDKKHFNSSFLKNRGCRAQAVPYGKGVNEEGKIKRLTLTPVSYYYLFAPHIKGHCRIQRRAMNGLF